MEDTEGPPLSPRVGEDRGHSSLGQVPRSRGLFPYLGPVHLIQHWHLGVGNKTKQKTPSLLLGVSLSTRKVSLQTWPSRRVRPHSRALPAEGPRPVHPGVKSPLPPPRRKRLCRLPPTAPSRQHQAPGVAIRTTGSGAEATGAGQPPRPGSGKLCAARSPAPAGVGMQCPGCFRVRHQEAPIRHAGIPRAGLHSNRRTFLLAGLQPDAAHTGFFFVVSRLGSGHPRPSRAQFWHASGRTQPCPPLPSAGERRSQLRVCEHSFIYTLSPEGQSRGRWRTPSPWALAEPPV